jgi:hypothetical protein
MTTPRNTSIGKPLGEQKYTRRAGRATGRSIAAGKEIEYQRGSDE